MVDSLAMFFGAKKRRKSPSRKSSSHGTVVVRGRERKLHKGKNGGLYYKTKTGRAYVDAKFIRAHKKSPARRRASPMRRRRASPTSPCHQKSAVTKTSPCVTKTSSCVTKTVTRWGYGLGQPSLIDMMGPCLASCLTTTTTCEYHICPINIYRYI